MRILFAYSNPIALPLAEWLAGQGNEVLRYGEPITEEVLRDNAIELVISYTYRFLISARIIACMDGNIINLHTSYLPWNRGADPNFWSFWEGTPKGVSIHYIDERLDRGRIIAQKRVALDPEEESFASSYEKLHDAMRALFMEIWNDYPSWRARSFVPRELGSYHASADLKQLIPEPMDWNANISAFLHAHNNYTAGGGLRINIQDS